MVRFYRNPGFNSEALKSIKEHCKVINYPLFEVVIFDEMDIQNNIQPVNSKEYGRF